jgi:hypothetical protein
VRTKAAELVCFGASEIGCLFRTVRDLRQMEQFDLSVDHQAQGIACVDQRPHGDDVIERDDPTFREGFLDVDAAHEVQALAPGSSEEDPADVEVGVEDRDPSPKVDHTAALQIVLDRSVDAPDPAVTEFMLAEPEITHALQL